MEATDKKAVRGSAKIFGIQGNDHKALIEALGVARETFEVKWWWKYGQPQIDRIVAQIDVRPEKIGQTVSDLMRLNGAEMQVIVGCLPNGQPPYPDLIRINAEFHKAM